jgi:sugar lactone lactonase YvrE
LSVDGRSFDGSHVVKAELVQDARAEIGEGPIWDDRSGRLHWVDIRAGLVHRFSPADDSDLVLSVEQPVGSLGLGAKGGLVLALRDGFGLMPSGADRLEKIIEVEKTLTGNRMNDGRCDAAGRFWAGTMSAALDHVVGAGSLYRLEELANSLSPVLVLGGLTVANGIDWSPDGRLMYYIDSPTQRVDVFDFDVDSGALTHRRPFVEIPKADGLPDGMVVDAEGGVWVALFGAGRVRRYSPSAEIKQEIEVPVTLVTSATFGGPNLSDLYITTARHRLAPDERERQTHAGSLFHCRPGPAGRLTHRFRWV